MLKKLLIALLLIVVAAVLARDAIAGAVLTGGIKGMTGLSSTVESVHVGLLSTSVRVQGLKVLNPSGFTDRVMVDAPELYVDFDLPGLLTGTPHLETVRLHLEELTVIRESQGKLNLDALKAVQEGRTKTPAAEPFDSSRAKSRDSLRANPEPLEGERQPGHPSRLLIDHLELRLGRVTYKDYSRGMPPHTQTVGLNLHERYERITNPQAVASLILVRALANTAIARLANLDLASLQWQAGDALSGATAMASEALDAAANVGQQVGGRALNAAGETVDKAANAVKQLFQ